ncbi:MAG: CBS domain-containing protein [Planctomycetaceae bacterium]
MITVEELGTINPITVDDNTPLEIAAEILKCHHIHHLPVVAENRAIGMLSARDLLGVVPKGTRQKGRSNRPAKSINAGRTVKVGDVCSSNLVTIPCETTIYRAAWLMIQHKIRSLPMVRDNHVVGMLTDTDLLRACMIGVRCPKDPTEHWRHCPVAEYMSSPVWKTEPTDSALNAWMMMRERDVRHLAVVRNNGLDLVMGILSDDDVLEALRGTSAMEGSVPTATIQVAEIMTSHVVSVGKYDKLTQAAEKMLSHDIAAVLVMDACLEGIITRVDLLKAIVKMG